jgi:hypothetical protein
MLIREPTKKPGMKELKVNIPVKYHLQLHSLKVMEGRQIHGVVQEALDHYFANLRADAAEKAEEKEEDS